MVAQKIFVFTLGLCCSLGFVGCSGGGEGAEGRLDVYTVKGKITLAGNPVPGASVTYSPKDPKVSRVATGNTNDSGEYTLTTYEGGDGAAAGEYDVLVSKSGGSTSDNAAAMHDQYNKGGAAPASHSGGKAGAASGSALPARYATVGSSDLTATVTTDEATNVFDFDLKP